MKRVTGIACAAVLVVGFGAALLLSRVYSEYGNLDASTVISGIVGSSPHSPRPAGPVRRLDEKGNSSQVHT